MVIIMTNIAPLNLNVAQLTELLEENPSLRGMCVGYAIEYHVRSQLLQDPLVNSVLKMSDHSRESKFDFLVDTAVGDVRVEVKMLQNNGAIRMSKSYSGSTDCAEAGSIATFDILKSNLDVLAVSNPLTGRTYFVRSEDLPDSMARTVPDAVKHLFCKTRFNISSVRSFQTLSDLLSFEEETPDTMHLPHDLSETLCQTSSELPPN